MQEHLRCLVTNLEFVPKGEELGIAHSIRDAFREGKSDVKASLQRGAAVLQPIARLAKPPATSAPSGE